MTALNPAAHTIPEGEDLIPKVVKAAEGERGEHRAAAEVGLGV